jgi:enterochelin esterase family protein
MGKFLIAFITLFYAFQVHDAPVKDSSVLSDNQVISSKVLGYNLQYRVYTPAGYDQLSNLPVIYFTDGQWYLEGGDVPKKIDRLVLEKKMKPVIAVFVDNRDPDNLDNNRRNAQFLGNEKYVGFFKNELLPKIEKHYKAGARQKSRAIMGMSFGGLNATFFGAKASDTFYMLGIQPPALRPVADIHEMYIDQEKLPLKIFLSTGTVNDAEAHARELKKTLELKGYDFEYVEVAKGHNWENWNPLVDDALIYFFGW